MKQNENLLAQLAACYDQNSWFVCFNEAVVDLNEQEAVWKASESDHSIVQLVTHLLFYNERFLQRFSGKKVEELSDHYPTFEPRPNTSWMQLKEAYREIMEQWRIMIRESNEDEMETWSETLSDLFLHNAYHIGQIVMIRKRQDSWSESPKVNG